MNNNTTSSAPHGLFETISMAAASVNNILGLPLNAYVMWLILTGARDTLASDFFPLNLAISEILFTFSCACYIVYVQFKLLFSLDAFMFSLGLLFTARPLFLCFICVEYYVGVVHPMLFLRFKPLRKKVVGCCVVWLISLLSCIYSRYTYINPLYLYSVFIQNVIFFSVILFCCFSVLRVLKRPGPGEKGTEKKNTPKRRAFKIILLIMVSLTFYFLMYMIIIPLQCCMTNIDFLNVFSACISLALTTGFVQPVLYLHRTQKLFCFKKL